MITQEQLHTIIQLLEMYEFRYQESIGENICICCGVTGCLGERPVHQETCIMNQTLHDLRNIEKQSLYGHNISLKHLPYISQFGDVYQRVALA